MKKATVAGLVTKTDNDGEKILLTKRIPPPFEHFWCLPGGHIEPKETAIDAVVREVREETGIDFDPHFLTYNDEIFDEHEFYAEVLAFAGPGRGKIKPQDEEVCECRWFLLSDALKQPLAFNHKDIITIYVLKRRRVSQDERTGVTEEFKALRQEMNTTFNARLWGTLTYVILAGVISRLMGGDGDPRALVLLIFAALPFMLHTLSRERTRVRIASYIKQILEKERPGLKWETCLKGWRDEFFGENKTRGLLNTCIHVFALTGVQITVAVYASVCLTRVTDASIMHKLLGGVGLLLCLVCYGLFVTTLLRARRYDRFFARIREQVAWDRVSNTEWDE